MNANRRSWKNLPVPAKRENFKVSWTFRPDVAERMILGHVPEGMDDRWFILMENSWLLFHRSWTGSCIYGLKVDALPKGVIINDGWVSRNADEYSSTDLSKDVDLLSDLVRMYFLLPPSTQLNLFMAPD